MIIKKTTLIPKSMLFSSFGFSALQISLDNLIIKKCQPYIPKKTGRLIKSAIPLNGCVMWTAPYAKKQYYTHKGKGMRGPFWVERMWADTKKEIMDNLKGVINDIRKRS